MSCVPLKECGPQKVNALKVFSSWIRVASFIKMICLSNCRINVFLSFHQDVDYKWPKCIKASYQCQWQSVKPYSGKMQSLDGPDHSSIYKQPFQSCHAVIYYLTVDLKKNKKTALSFKLHSDQEMSVMCKVQCSRRLNLQWRMSSVSFLNLHIIARLLLGLHFLAVHIKNCPLLAV